MKMNNGVTAWAIRPSKYVNETFNNCEKGIQESEHKHGCRASNPFPTDYDPDLDTTTELDEEQATYYQSQIGILHWIAEFGRIDICKRSVTAGFTLCTPKKGTPTDSIHILVTEFSQQNWVYPNP